MQKYLNRKAAGLVLAQALMVYADDEAVQILALPRGGVPVAFEISKALHAPLDVFIVRKLGVPIHKELAMGALATNGVCVFNQEIIAEYDISQAQINAVIQEEKTELERREKLYRGTRPFPILKNKKIILVDDGIATGASIRAAMQALRQFSPQQIIIAVPVADKEIIKRLKLEVDDFVCPLQPEHLNAVGAWYDDFPQTEDAEVKDLLTAANAFSTVR